MLIQSDRHTAEDLALWNGFEHADILNGATLLRKGRHLRPLEEISWFADQPCYVSMSWGKDSVVVAHLCVMNDVPLRFVHIVQDGLQYDPDIPRVRDAFLSRYDIDYHEIRVSSSKSQRDTDKAPGLVEGIKLAAEKFGTPRWIGGLRASESSARTIRMRKGVSFGVSCSPIGWWSTSDVFGWLAYHNLPVHPAYACLGGGRYCRDQIRVSIIGGAKARNFGRDEWEREYYGEELRRIEAAQ